MKPLSGKTFSSALPEPLANSRSVQVLERSLEKKRLAHGILLHGSDLCTLETVAHTLAGVLLACGDKAVKHPDCFLLRPSNKMRSISAEDIRQLIQNLSMTANQGGAKVAILYEVDRMNLTASNILLKTLEEPPPATTLLLLSIQPYKLLPTIRSRTFHFRLSCTKQEIKEEAWQQWLERYRQWLQTLQSPLAKPEERAQVLLTTYNLIVHFEDILTQISTSAWKNEAKHLPEALSTEQETALKVSSYKSTLRRLLTHLAEATHLYCTTTLHRSQHPSGSVLVNIIAELEHLVGLLEVNLNEATALEHFLLQSLKIWRQHRP